MSRFLALNVHVSKCIAVGVFFLAFNFCGHSSGAEAQELKLSNSVSSHICGQHQQFQDSSSIQEPVKGRPENDDAKCGWLKWTKCDTENSGDSDCPNFTFEPCQEAGEPKKGRSAAVKEGEEEPPDACPPPLKFPGLEAVTPPNKYPQLVAIHRGLGCYNKACWGAIINEEWLVVPQTSGCFASFTPTQPDDYHIIAGDRVIYVEEGTEQVRKVAQFIPHPEFNYTSFHHYRANLGLVKLDQPLEFNDDVQPMDLNLVKEISSTAGAPLENLTIATWLASTKDAPNNDRLIDLPVEFIPESECWDKFMEGDGATNESLICAGKCLVSGGQPSTGLSQGFLFTWRESSGSDAKGEKVPVPVGIGPVRQYNSRANGRFGVFTDLSFYIPWIEETMKNNQGNTKGQGQGRSSKGRGTGAGGNGRYAGSFDSPPHKYPSMVNMWKTSGSPCLQHQCGGTILSPLWIMTAAHCVKEKVLPEQIKLIVGDHDQSKPEGTEQELKVEKIIRHERWAKERPKYDIALLKVSPPIQMNDKVKPAKLPEPDFDSELKPLQACGWGLFEGYIPYILKEVELPIISIEECSALLNASEAPLPDKELHVCAASTEKQACPGDSGGPLYLLSNEAGEQTVLGLSNYLPADGLALCQVAKAQGLRAEDSEARTIASVYTRVSHYIDWINQNSNNLS